MGLFGKFFEKATCDICGKETGHIMGKRKLEDGMLCKECDAKLSPWFDGRRHSTLESIREQLADREANEQLLDEFNTTLTIGSGDHRLLIDEDAGRFIITTSAKWKEGNPDVLSLSQVKGCTYNIDESRSEEMRTNSEGERVSYNPPRYSYDYDFYVTISVDARWFDEIRFRVNNFSIDDDRSGEYKNCERTCNEMREHLMNARKEIRQAAAVANQPKSAVVCACCGATTIPDDHGRCEYCGGAVNG